MTQGIELTALSSVELRRRIGAKEISPVELLEACVARIEALNPAVNAVTATTLARARREARAAEAAVRAGEPLGALHGLPSPPLPMRVGQEQPFRLVRRLHPQHLLPSRVLLRPFHLRPRPRVQSRPRR